MIIQQWDYDGDSKINLDEYMEFSQKQFHLKDSNGDGYIDESEQRAGAPNQRQGQGGQPRQAPQQGRQQQGQRGGYGGQGY